MLLYLLGEIFDEVLISFGLSEDSKKCKAVESKFDSYFIHQSNVIYKRAVFICRCQHLVESVNEFVTALYLYIGRELQFWSTHK